MGHFLLFMFRVCHTFLSVHCILLAFLYEMFSCVFVTFPCGVLCQVWYMIVPIPDLCLLTYFNSAKQSSLSSVLSLSQVMVS